MGGSAGVASALRYGRARGGVALLRAASVLATLKPEGDEKIGVDIDLVKAGVIAPTKVTRSALQNAASISALMLTTEAMICEIPEKKPAPMPGGDHGPGGMDY